MAQKKPLTDEELLAQFESLEGGSSSSSSSSKPKTSSSAASSKPLLVTKANKPALANNDVDDLAELESLAKARPASRPGTPKVLANTQTPGSTPTASTRTSEDGKTRIAAPRKSTESSRSYHQGLTPTSEEERLEEEAVRKVAEEKDRDEEKETKKGDGGGWGSWFGGITAAASAAAKQAEAYAKEIQKNEEAQKWTEQLRGRVGGLDLKGLGDLRNRALPTFTNIINTIAPPISQHERLQIHITHDLVGYPSLDPTIYAVFSRVMSQVEGGDLLVIQRGSESTGRHQSEVGFRGGSSGWSDGPWWRDGLIKRDMGVVEGLSEGTKLTRVNAEAFAKEFFASKGGIEKAAENATKILSESNPVRSSDVFLAIQPIGYDVADDLFEGPTEAAKSEQGLQDEQEKDNVVAFAVYLFDPVHSITFKSISQSVPRKWISWLDAENVSEGNQLPEEIVEIIEAGGVDPREWVAEWIEEIVSQVVGVIAQRYVAKRMGVGEGGIGRGKQRQEFEDAAAGEAARAL